MNYIGSVVKRVADIYNQINTATLTGAIDIVVIKHPDGSFVGSPFHVRFGKLGVLSSREKVVEISINNVEVDLQMKLGAAGEAFFVERALTEENIPINLATSPLPSQNNFLNKDFNFSINKEKREVEDVLDDVAELSTETTITDVAATDLTVSKSIDIPYKSSSNPILTIQRATLQDNYPLSDLDSPISSPLSRSPIDEESGMLRQILSDTEIEINNAKESDKPNITWKWGMLPEKSDEEIFSKRRVKSDRLKKAKQAKQVAKASAHGLLLDEVLAADKEVADLYLNRTNSLEDFDVDSGLGHGSTPKQIDEWKDDGEPKPTDNDVNTVSISLCGDLKNRRIEPEKFLEFRVKFEDFCKNPDLLFDPMLVIRIDDKYYNWRVAAPVLMSYIIYKKMPTEDCLKSLKQKYMPRKRRGWFSGWRATHEELESSDEEELSNKHSNVRSSPEKMSSADELDSDNNGISNRRSSSLLVDDDPEYKKTLRLTSIQWQKLNLNYGANRISFTVTTRYQGTATCDARIFLWDHTDKIVISDIDGTITRSDVLGQILPAVGKDWSQTDVTGLFSNIERNGYHFMYLSARAIGQATITRDFLRNVKQGELTLPDGPVFLTPTSLLNAFKKEVIERKPEEFKISCMRDILSLFPPKSNPFYSGFGNRINDVWAYRAVGIPISHIFTINYKGEIKHELTNAFTSTYGKLLDIVDQMFPYVKANKTFDLSRSEYTYFSYWRNPLPDLPEGEFSGFEFPL